MNAMVTFGLRFEKGRFTPLDPVPELQDGDEIEVEWSSTRGVGDVSQMLDRTRGLWADWDGIEELIEDGDVWRQGLQ